MTATPRRIVLNENRLAGEPIVLDQSQAAAIAGSGLAEPRPVGGGMWRLAPATNRVGALLVGDLELVVRPKAPFASVLFMLGYARDPHFPGDEVGARSEADLWPVLAATLAQLTERALAQGVLQGYRSYDESLAVVRGRLLVATQAARHPGLPVPLEVRHDEFDADVAENQILRTALRRLMVLPGVPRPVRQRLAHLEGRLTARLLTPGAPLPAWHASRLNERYWPALRLSELVLRHLGLGVAPGGQAVASFVVDMAEAFEGFVTAALREGFAAVSDGVTHGQYDDRLDVAGQVPIRPDVVHVVSGRPVAVLDAKYKLADGALPGSDVYQLLAYCTALELARGYLIYAGGPGADPPPVRVRHCGIEVVRCSIDVAARPPVLRAQLAAIARQAL